MGSADNAWPSIGPWSNATEYGGYLIEEIRQFMQFTTGKGCYKRAKHTQRAWVVQKRFLARSVFISIDISSIGTIEKDLLTKSSQIKCQRSWCAIVFSRGSSQARSFMMLLGKVYNYKNRKTGKLPWVAFWECLKAYSTLLIYCGAMEKRTSSLAGLEVNKTCEAKPEIASFFMVLVVDRRPSCQHDKKNSQRHISGGHLHKTQDDRDYESWRKCS
jgi:hypothetical protein